MNWKRKKVVAATACLVFLSILSFQRRPPTILSTRSDRADIIVLVAHENKNTTVFPRHNSRNNNTNTSINKNCVVHVHGLHHSGTGFMRESVYNSLGGKSFASKHVNTKAPQDEGQHLQTVYPTFRKRLRFPKQCGVPNSQVPAVETLHKLYDCLTLVDTIPNVTTAKHELHSQWSRYWNMRKPYLLQKTPTMDVVLLEQLKIHPTVHVVVMRHPFGWKRVLPQQNTKYKSLQQDVLYLPVIWWNVWTNLLQELRNVESYIVVQYETLVQHLAGVSYQMSDYIRRECHVEHQTSQRRRLNLYPQIKNATKYIISETAVQEFQACQANTKCSNFMNQTASVLQEYGYHWDPQVPFHSPPTTGGEGSLLLYTSKKPPPMELVERMKAVASTITA